MSSQPQPLRIENTASGRVWRMKEYSEITALAIAQGLQLPSLIAQILAARGFTKETVSDFLNSTLKQTLPDPSALKDMDQAVDAITQALMTKQKIAIFGDYDVDGATSSALLYRYFRMLGVEVAVSIPDRIDDGYGPTQAGFDRLKKDGAKLVITVDCGTTAFDPLAYAADIGLDVIVIDHHTAEPLLPKAIAVVNPNRLDEPVNPAQSLAAVGVSFLLLVALNRHLRQNGFFEDRQEPDLISLLDLVALGTVCDVMPLKGLNRAFVKQGLKVLSRRQNLGLKTLIDLTGIDTQPSCYHLGFIIGPRINAGGRVGEAGLGSLLLRTENPVLADQVARKLDHYNALRKEVEQEVLDQSIEQALRQHRSVIITSGVNWHPGVIGIVAGRLKERFNRPSCVISFDAQGIGKGSGRSIPGLDLGSIIHAARQTGLLLAGGGHAMAAGFTIEQNRLAEFHDYLEERFAKNLPKGYQPEVDIDAVLNIRSLTMDLAEKLEQLGPFGPGNMTPKFAVLNVLVQYADIVGAQHIKMVVGQLDGARLEAIAFRAVDTELGRMILCRTGQNVNLLGTIKRDSWQGREKLTFIVEDIAPINELYQLAG